MGEIAVPENALTNPCCITLKQKYAELKKGRNALKDCLRLLETHIAKVEAGNQALKKECQEEKAKADNEREEKEREYAKRVALENELDALKIECQMLQRDGGSSSENLEGEVQRLEKDISEGKEEINRLKELVENEKLRTNAEKKRADAEKKGAEAEVKKAKDALKKVKEDKKLTDLERKQYDENKVQLEALKTELAQVKVNLEKTVKQLEIEKLRPDSVEKRDESERNKADEALREDKRVSDDESKKSEEYRAQLEDLKAEIVQVKLNFEETKKQLDIEKTRVDAEKKRAESEKKKVESLRKKANEAEKKVKEDTRLSDVERKNFEESKAQLDILKTEIVQVKTNLEETKKQLEKEKTRADSEKKRADAEKKKFESEKKKANQAEKKVKSDTRLADVERKKSEESRAQLAVLKTEIIHVKAVLEETKEQLEKEKRRADAEKKRADTEKERADSERKKGDEAVKKMKEVNRLGDVEKRTSKQNTSQLEILKTGTVGRKENSEENKPQLENESGKSRKRKKCGELAVIEGYDDSKVVERLHQEVESNKHGIQEMQSVIKDLLSSKNLLMSPLYNKNSESESSEIKLLRKKLKFEKMLVKHAKQVTELEVARNNILQYELGKMKQEILKFSEHLTVLDNPAFKSDAGIAGHAKLCSRPSKRKLSHEQPHPINNISSQDFMKPCSTGNASHSKYSVKCSAPLHEGCSGETVSGIHSKLDHLRRGPNQKMLQSSAINSCSASYSDRPLVDSQEDGAFPISTSTNLTEENSNLEQFPFSLTTSVLHHSHTIATQKDNKDYNKNSESPGTIGSTGKMCQAVIHNLSDPSLPEKGSVIPVLQDNWCIEDTRSSKKRKKNAEEYLVAEGAHRTSSTVSDLCKQAPRSRSSPAMSDGVQKNGIDDLLSNPDLPGSWNGYNLCNIVKLLDLDSEEDERSFCAAMERPMSPSIPVLESKSLNTADISGCKDSLDNNFYRGRSNLQGNASKCGSVVENEYNNALNSTRQLHKSNDLSCPVRKLDGFEKADVSQITDSRFCRDGESSPQMSDTVTIERETLGIQKYDVPLTCSNLTRYVIVFPEIKDAGSISRIFNAVGRISHCTMISSSNYVKESLIILAGDVGLSSKEKVCTFVTVMLQKISEDMLRNSGRSMESDFCQFIDTFSCNMNVVLSDIKMKNIMMDLWDLSDLLEIVEDFLINRRALLFDDASSNLIKSLPLDRNRGVLCPQQAPISLLVAGGALLATLCASIDDIGFVCEISCNILRTQKTNSSLVLIILHVIAHIRGPRFFGEGYGLVVDVIRSLVVHLEKLNSSYSIASCFPSLVEGPSKPWPFCNCPFLDEASSIDVVVSLLLKELHNYIVSFTKKRDHLDSTNLSMSGAKMYEMDYFKDDPVRVCENFDVFSLLELVSGIMSWDWSLVNIVCPVFKLLESCAMECVSAAIITLLGQVGRIGVEERGYDDAKIENLRNQFTGFLSGNSGLLVQLASATALSGLLPCSFEDLVNSDCMIPAAAVSFKNWFSSLSDEQQSSFKVELLNNFG